MAVRTAADRSKRPGRPARVIDGAGAEAERSSRPGEVPHRSATRHDDRGALARRVTRFNSPRCSRPGSSRLPSILLQAIQRPAPARAPIQTARNNRVMASWARHSSGQRPRTPHGHGGTGGHPRLPPSRRCPLAPVPPAPECRTHPTAGPGPPRPAPRRCRDPGRRIRVARLARGWARAAAVESADDSRCLARDQNEFNAPGSGRLGPRTVHCWLKASPAPAPARLEISTRQTRNWLGFNLD